MGWSGFGRGRRRLVMLQAFDVAEFPFEEVVLILHADILPAVKRIVPGIAIGAVLGVMAILLRLQGRLWTCACGYVWLWSGNINSADNSQHVFDPYSFTHILHGFLFIGIVYLLWPKLPNIWKFVVVISTEAVWEIVENSSFVIQRYRAATISIGYVGDTILNSFGDVVACTLGALIARQLGLKKTVVIAVSIEVLLLLTIRDSLLLNIVMLLHPIEAIRIWQSAH
jgi:hypothetical protein